MKNCPKCNELVGNSVDVCFNCHYSFSQRKLVSQEDFSKKQKDNEERYKRNIEEEKLAYAQKEQQLINNPHYEYVSVVVNDLDTGEIDNKQIQYLLEKYSQNGWRLHTIFTNEIGKTATAVKIGFLGGAVNATIDQTVLIFERCIKPENK